MRGFVKGLLLGLVLVTGLALGQGVRSIDGTSVTLYDQGGNIFTFPSASGAVIVGSGTTNFLPKLTASGTVTDSVISDVGGSVTVDATSFATINGDIGIFITGGTGAGSTADIFMAADDNINLTATGDNIDLTSATVTSTFTGLAEFSSSDRVRIITNDNASLVEVNDGANSVTISTISASGLVSISAGGSGGRVTIGADDGVGMPNTTQANIGTPTSGTIMYCTNCNPDSTCSSGGSGAFAFRVNSAWACEMPPHATEVGTGAFFFPHEQGFDATTNAAIIAANNQTRWWRFYLDRRITVSRMAFNVAAATGGATCGTAIYNSAGTTRLINGGGADCSTTGVKDVDVTDTTIGPGYYIIAYTASSTSVTVTSRITVAALSNIWNATVGQMGTAANAGAAGVPPTTLGTLTPASQNRIFAKLQS